MEDKIKESLADVVAKALLANPHLADMSQARRVVDAIAKDYEVRPKVQETPEHPLRWTKATDILYQAIFGAAPWDNVMASDEARAQIKKGLEALQDHDIELADNWVVAHHRERKELLGWRGRRMAACKGAERLHAVVDMLGVDDKSDTLNLKGGHYPLDPGLRVELKNQVATLLRMILVLNDGQVSEQRLQGF